MLIEALRPSLLEGVQQELAPLREAEAAFGLRATGLERRVDALQAKLSDDLAARLEGLLKDAQQHLDHELELRLASFRAQFVLIKTELEAGKDELLGLLERLGERIDRIEGRLSAAGTALSEQLRDLARPEPEEAAPLREAGD
jgi:hypothetical protein